MMDKEPHIDFEKKLDEAISLLYQLNNRIDNLLSRIDLPKHKQQKVNMESSQPVEWLTIDPSWEKPTKILFNEEYYFANSWLKVLERILTIFYKKDPEKFKQLPSSHIQGRSGFYFSNTSDNIRKPKLLFDCVYFETNLSAKLVLTIMRELFDFFEEDCNSMKLYLRGEISNDTSSNSGDGIEDPIENEDDSKIL